MIMMSRWVPLVVGMFALIGCAGDTRETGELGFRREGWDVQRVAINVMPARAPTWCRVEAMHGAEVLHQVPGVIVLPLRGRSADVTCWNTHGLIGNASMSRQDTGRWPETVDVRMVNDPRFAEPVPGVAEVSPARRR